MRSSLLGSFAVIRRSASRSCAGQFVRLGRHDEVVLVETFYFLGLPRDLGPAPSEADIGMVALALGQTAEPGYEVQGFLEIPERKAPLDTTLLVHERPTGRLLQIAFGLRFRQRRNTAATRRASLGQEIFAHTARSRKTNLCPVAGDITLAIFAGLNSFGHPRANTPRANEFALHELLLRRFMRPARLPATCDPNARDWPPLRSCFEGTRGASLRERPPPGRHHRARRIRAAKNHTAPRTVATGFRQN